MSMKSIITTFAVLLVTLVAIAQSPEKMSYQAIIRDNANALVINQSVGMQISILQGSTAGSAVYVETQTSTTNLNGLATIEIGTGTVVSSGNFASIDWANGPFYIKTETDPTGGSTYTISGVSQMLSVPYALYAKTSGNGAGPVGPQGPAGAQGPAGTPDFAYNESYDVGPLPAYDGVTYASLLTMTAPSSGLYWISMHTETYTDLNMTGPVASLSAIFINGSMNDQFSQNVHQHEIGKSITLVAGDIVELRCASNVGGGRAVRSFGSIQKIQ